MGNVIVQAAMSLHGFIADTNDQVGPMFDWYRNGDVDFTGSDPNMVFHVSPASTEYLRTAWSNVAVDVIGRRLFDLTNGWNGRPAVGEAVFVVTHEPPVRIDLVPVVFGSGVRYFGNYDESTLLLEDPEGRPGRPSNASALSNTKVMIMPNARKILAAS
jgi:hypothetical protein